MQKAAKKSLVKKGKVKKRTTVKSNQKKGHGLDDPSTIADLEMTREEQITKMEKQKSVELKSFLS